MKKLIIVRGISGSGKSTLARELVYRNRSDCGGRFAYCSADNFFNVGDEYLFDAAKLPEAHASCFAEFVRAIRLGVPLIIVDNTFARLWMYDNYIHTAKLKGYEVEVHQIVTDSIEAVRQAAARNQHSVPAETIFRMACEFEVDKRDFVVNHEIGR